MSLWVKCSQHGCGFMAGPFADVSKAKPILRTHRDISKRVTGHQHAPYYFNPEATAARAVAEWPIQECCGRRLHECDCKHTERVEG